MAESQQPPASREERLKRLGIRESEVRESFVRSAGHGGQNVNKTSTCVQLLHLPTGIQVKCQTHRHQAQNRDRAWDLLLEKISAQQQARRRQQVAELEKARRRNRPRSQSAKRRILQSKAHRATKKSLRKSVASD